MKEAKDKTAGRGSGDARPTVRLRPCAATHKAISVSEEPTGLQTGSSTLSETIDICAEKSRADELEGFPVQGWDRYRFVSFVGEGGMGKVYKAFDDGLQRAVALKFIRREDPQLSKRLLQEAQAQARVEHEHVCKVYEVGQIQNKLYIAMQFIEGEDLKHAATRMTLEEAVKVMKEVSEAMHAAHRLGLVHRDIKPANIMVESKEHGLHPYVMDFGLAREYGTEDLTMTTNIVGTPSYMAPEQVKRAGAALDRRVDVYSLGATLYEVLAGLPPFEGDTGVDILCKVLQEEPTPPRKLRPSIPRDLETIVLKCLEKDPRRRYDSGKALSEELGRYLEGDPIHASSPSLARRAVKKIWKNKALYALGSAAALALVGVLVVWTYSRWQAREQARLAGRFGERVKQIESIMRSSAMLPLHDVRPELEVIEKKIMEMEELMGGVGAVGEGPALYALGRGYLALGRNREALQHLNLAWDRGYRSGEVAYALGKALGAVYQKRLTEIERVTSRSGREAALREIDEQYRVRALAYLRQASGQASMDATQYAQALFSFYEKKYELAADKADAALTEAAWLFEAHNLKGDCYMALGESHRARGEMTEAERHYERAQAAYEEAVHVARSSPEGYQGLCDRWSAQIYIDVEQGVSPEAAFERARDACGNALLANPQSSHAYNNQANAYKRWASWLIAHGEDPSQALDACVDAATRALALEPDYAYARLNLGVAYRLKGEQALKLEQDPSADLALAVTHLERAVEVDPNFVHGYNNLGLSYYCRAQFESLAGKDPRAAVQNALRHFRKVAELDPTFVYVYNNLGNAAQLEAGFESQRGLDPGPNLDAAEAYYAQALSISSDQPLAHLGLGQIYLAKAKRELSKGTDPGAMIQKAMRHTGRALAIKPDLALARDCQEQLAAMRGALR